MPSLLLYLVVNRVWNIDFSVHITSDCLLFTRFSWGINKLSLIKYLVLAVWAKLLWEFLRFGYCISQFFTRWLLVLGFMFHVGLQYPLSYIYLFTFKLHVSSWFLLVLPVSLCQCVLAHMTLPSPTRTGGGEFVDSKPTRCAFIYKKYLRIKKKKEKKSVTCVILMHFVSKYPKSVFILNCFYKKSWISYFFVYLFRRIIHTVGPKYAVKYHTAAENALSHCYRSCLELLIDNGLKRLFSSRCYIFLF